MSKDKAPKNSNQVERPSKWMHQWTLNKIRDVTQDESTQTNAPKRRKRNFEGFNTDPESRTTSQSNSPAFSPTYNFPQRQTHDPLNYLTSHQGYRSRNPIPNNSQAQTQIIEPSLPAKDKTVNQSTNSTLVDTKPQDFPSFPHVPLFFSPMGYTGYPPLFGHGPQSYLPSFPYTHVAHTQQMSSEPKMCDAASNENTHEIIEPAPLVDADHAYCSKEDESEEGTELPAIMVQDVLPTLANTFSTLPRDKLSSLCRWTFHHTQDCINFVANEKEIPPQSRHISIDDCSNWSRASMLLSGLCAADTYNRLCVMQQTLEQVLKNVLEIRAAQDQSKSTDTRTNKSNSSISNENKHEEQHREKFVQPQKAKGLKKKSARKDGKSKTETVNGSHAKHCDSTSKVAKKTEESIVSHTHTCKNEEADSNNSKSLNAEINQVELKKFDSSMTDIDINQYYDHDFNFIEDADHSWNEGLQAISNAISNEMQWTENSALHTRDRSESIFWSQQLHEQLQATKVANANAHSNNDNINQKSCPDHLIRRILSDSIDSENANCIQQGKEEEKEGEREDSEKKEERENAEKKEEREDAEKEQEEREDAEEDIFPAVSFSISCKTDVLVDRTVISEAFNSSQIIEMILRSKCCVFNAHLVSILLTEALMRLQIPVEFQLQSIADEIQSGIIAIMQIPGSEQVTQAWKECWEQEVENLYNMTISELNGLFRITDNPTAKKFALNSLRNGFTEERTDAILFCTLLARVCRISAPMRPPSTPVREECSSNDLKEIITPDWRYEDQIPFYAEALVMYFVMCHLRGEHYNPEEFHKYWTLAHSKGKEREWERERVVACRNQQWIHFYDNDTLNKFREKRRALLNGTSRTFS